MRKKKQIMNMIVEKFVAYIVRKTATEACFKGL